jgi:hypothetical protein
LSTNFSRVNDVSGPAVNWLAVISGLSTVNGVCDADPVLIDVPFAATDVLAGVTGIL